ncbi:hypothetical protein D1B33_01780 [Lysinibacillus yapensis]|uniref:Uncharacterized protein n=1 Tax=Ureibacillus yapensis TaxID=2304605 RepID=A0A396ST09_9BACL|nr:hypothetical protein [Lysinibacillus yapensis]RHW39601.1 hypothetical protein D1B33_01780 [Lysinibacillus yapensis]
MERRFIRKAQAPRFAPTDVLCIESEAADTSAGRPESKASFQLSTEGRPRPQIGLGAGARHYSSRVFCPAKDDLKIFKVGKLFSYGT